MPYNFASDSFHTTGSTGAVDPKFQIEGGAPTNHSSYQKTRLNDLSYGIKNFATIHAFNRRTDGRTDRQTDRQLSHR